MPSALLAALERIDDGHLSATLPVAGKSVLQWQADLALGLGCDRIVCLSVEHDAEIIRVQNAVEAAGAEFHVAKSPRQVSALAPSSGDLIVMRDSLVVDSEIAAAAIGGAQAIAAIATEHSEYASAAHRYERIDRTRAWAGLARLPSCLASELAEFPADNDTVSLLLRLALQSGVEPKEIDSQWLSDKKMWAVAGSVMEADEIEAQLFDRATGEVGSRSLSATLALMIARKLHLAVSAPLSASMGALGLGLLACAVPIALWSTVSLSVAILAIGSFFISAGAVLVAFSDRLYHRPSGARLQKISATFRDLLIVAALTLPATDLPEAALPLFCIGLIRLAELSSTGKALGVIWEDRPIQLLIIAIFAYFDHVSAVLIALGLGAMVTCFTERQPP